MKILAMKIHGAATRTTCLLVALLTADVSPAAPANAPTNAPIPWEQIGAKAGAEYHGNGLSVTRTAAGAKLNCIFQRLAGEATPAGLWLTSVVTNQAPDRFRVTAVAVGRAGSPGPATGGASVLASHWDDATDEGRLANTGAVSVDGQTVRFTRPGLVEEYTVSMDGVRQDFVVCEKPGGASVRASRLVGSLAPSSHPSPPMGEKVAAGRLRGRWPIRECSR